MSLLILAVIRTRGLSLKRQRKKESNQDLHLKGKPAEEVVGLSPIEVSDRGGKEKAEG